jgi:putative toxin-antitoxin system antitoxin component (TIGR02293 family)
MTSLFETARFLGLPAKGKRLESASQYLHLLDKGLPLRSINKIAGALAPEDRQFRYRIVPKATLARLMKVRRRKERRRLNKAQSELVTRLAGVWTDANRVWKTEANARSFLYRKHPLLENKRPVDLTLQSEVGAQLVRDILGRLEHGTAV